MRLLSALNACDYINPVIFICFTLWGPNFHVMRSAILCQLYILKNVESTHGGGLLLVKLQALLKVTLLNGCFLNCTNSNKSHNAYTFNDSALVYLPNSYCFTLRQDPYLFNFRQIQWFYRSITFRQTFGSYVIHLGREKNW